MFVRSEQALDANETSEVFIELCQVIDTQTFLGFLFGQQVAVRWSNFDRRDPKMEVFLQSTEATHADIFLNESLPPKTPRGHHVHGRLAMVLW
jgi:hypothetical protein